MICLHYIGPLLLANDHPERMSILLFCGMVRWFGERRQSTICLFEMNLQTCSFCSSVARLFQLNTSIIIIIIGRLQSRRLRASSSHNDPMPIQTACPGQSCCLCLPKGVECIWETGFVAFLVFSSHVVEYTVRTLCMAHHQASWVHGPETSVGGFWHFLLATTNSITAYYFMKISFAD